MSLSLNSLSVATLQTIRKSLAESVAQSNDSIRQIDLAIDVIAKQKDAAAKVLAEPNAKYALQQGAAVLNQ